MTTNLIVFNLAYYLVNFLLYQIAISDPSSSLGVGFFILIFWIAALVLLFFFCHKKVIQVKTVADKIGVFTATPVLIIVLIQILIKTQI